MKFNEKYGRWFTKGGLVYRYSKNQDKLILCKTTIISVGYETLRTEIGMKRVHRIVWETFNGEIPDGYEIDHIDGNRLNNALSNLRCVTHTENMANPITRARLRKPKKVKGNHQLGITKSDFGKKFKEHFGINMSDNKALYSYHHLWYRRHNNVCKWEKEAMPPFLISSNFLLSTIPTNNSREFYKNMLQYYTNEDFFFLKYHILL